MDHITALKRAVEMLDHIGKGHSYDAAVYLEALNQFRETSTRPLDVSAIQQLAFDNGILVVDWINADSLHAHFPDLHPEHIPALLDELSTNTGDYPVDTDKVVDWITQAADRQSIDLYPLEEDLGTTNHRERCNELARSVGFSDAEDFLGYCHLHSLTERALFNGTQIGTMQKMAGFDEQGDQWLAFPQRWESCDMRDIIAEVRKLLNPNKKG